MHPGAAPCGRARDRRPSNASMTNPGTLRVRLAPATPPSRVAGESRTRPRAVALARTREAAGQPCSAALREKRDQPE
jgi:hypothetical protein